MALKIGDTVTIVIGQPLPAGEPVDELIYTEMGYMPMSLLDLKHEVQDSTGFEAKGGQLDQNTLQLTVEKVGSFAHVTEHRYLGDIEAAVVAAVESLLAPDEGEVIQAANQAAKEVKPIKRSAHVHTYDKLDLFPEQGSMK